MVRGAIFEDTSSLISLSIIVALCGVIFFLIVERYRREASLAAERKETASMSPSRLHKERDRILQIFNDKDKKIQDLFSHGNPLSHDRGSVPSPASSISRRRQSISREDSQSAPLTPDSKGYSASPVAASLLRKRSFSSGNPPSPSMLGITPSSLNPPNMYLSSSPARSTASSISSSRTEDDILKPVVSSTSSGKHTPRSEGSIYGCGLLPAAVNEAGLYERHEYHDPVLITNMESKVIIQISAGGEHVLFLSDTGDVYNWGGSLLGKDSNGASTAGIRDSKDESGPKIVASLALEKALTGHRIFSISCGANHSVVINEIGEIFSWGDGADGRLGHGDTEIQSSPRKVLALFGHKVTQVSCGGAHTMALTQTHSVYTWGRGHNGRLGHDDVKSLSTPTEVISLKDKRVKCIASGYNFSVAVTNQGHVYCWGKGDQGQCGYKYAQDQLAPRRVESLAGEIIVHVSCGYLHSLALSHNGHVWSWGHGEHGQLGLHRSMYQPEPANVGIAEHLPPMDRIVQISCGTWHSIALSQGGIVLSWGKNLNGVLGFDPKEVPFSFVPKQISSLPSNGISQIVAGRDFTFILREGNKRRRSSIPRQFLSSPELSRKATMETSWRSSSSLDSAKLEKAKCSKLEANILVWKDIVGDWEMNRASSRTQMLYRSGIPPSMRCVVWPLAIGNHLKMTPTLFEILKKRTIQAKEEMTIHVNDRKGSAGATTINSSGVEEEGVAERESSLHLINVDLPRTFPELRLFGGGDPFYNQLREILEVYVLYRPDVGYIQGMSYLAAMICLYEPDDSYLSFQSLCNLLASHHLYGFFSLERDTISKFCSVFDFVLKENNPPLWNHLKFLAIPHEMYLFPWLQTLFLKNLPLPLASRVWDCFLFEGVSFLFKTAISILNLFTPILNGASYEDTAALLTSSSTTKSHWDKHIQETNLFKAIGNVTISKAAHRDLNSLTNDVYFYRQSTEASVVLETDKQKIIKVESATALSMM